MSRSSFIVAVGLFGLIIGLIGCSDPQKQVDGSGSSTRAPDSPRPTLIVEAEYPGTSSEIVAALAVPIEKLAAGLKGVLRTESVADERGGYALTITLRDGTDVAAAQRLLQAKIETALAGASDDVRRSVRVRDESPRAQFVVVLSSSDGGKSEAELFDYADKQLKNEFAQAAGVSSVRLVGRMPNPPVPSFVDVLLNGRPVLYPSPQTSAGYATVAGRPVMALFLYAHSQASRKSLSADVNRRLQELRGRLPAGMKLDVPFDFTSAAHGADCFAVEISTPHYHVDGGTSASVDRLLKVFDDVAGVEFALGLTRSPIDRKQRHAEEVIVLVRLSASHATPNGRRKFFEQLDGSSRFSTRGDRVTLHDLGSADGAGAGPSLRFALSGAPAKPKPPTKPTGPSVPPVPIYDRIRRLHEVTGVVAFPAQAEHLYTHVTFNRKAAEGKITLERFEKFVAAELHRSEAELETRQGGFLSEWIMLDDGHTRSQLSAYAKVESKAEPGSIYRVDGEPAVVYEVEIAPGFTPAGVRERIKKQVAPSLPENFRLHWLDDDF